MQEELNFIVSPNIRLRCSTEAVLPANVPFALFLRASDASSRAEVYHLNLALDFWHGNLQSALKPGMDEIVSLRYRTVLQKEKK